MHQDRKKRLLKKYGLKGVNKPKMTPKHKKSKAIVLAQSGHQLKVIRFGAQGMGHNYSAAARRSFKARHAKNIKEEKCLQHTGQINFYGIHKAARGIPQNHKSKYLVERGNNGKS